MDLMDELASAYEELLLLKDTHCELMQSWEQDLAALDSHGIHFDRDWYKAEEGDLLERMAKERSRIDGIIAKGRL